jgi:tetratricopeptide (TPR) repeat protein
MSETGNDQQAGSPSGWPATGNVAGGPVNGVIIQAGVVTGGVHLAAGTPSAVPLPHQLPAGPARLVDRAAELGVLDGLLASARRGPLLVVITGAPGMGKTAVALWWLHAHDGEFPDGQLHADLDSSHGGEAPADVLARWLRALGVPPEWIPAAEAELAALWRSVTAGKKLAVLVENAASAAGIRMLLPGAGPSVVAVTSRRRLPAAAGDGAQFIHMGPLPAEAAVGLLGQIAGAARVAAEHAAALRLVAYCGSVPLAVCAAAGQLAISAGDRIADAAAGLDPLNALDNETDKETGMRASLDAAYAALDPGTARAYRLLGLHPGPDFTAGLAAAALDASRAEARALLGRLATACLAEPTGQGRYRFHDLIRAHSLALAGQREPAPDRSAVLARIAGWYLCNCAEAERLLQQYRHGLRRDAAPPPREGPEVTAETALDWMEAERHGLRAVVEAAADDLPAGSWQLADAMWPLFLYRGHYREQLDISRSGLDAARRCGDAEGQARMLDRIGMAARHLGRPDEAAGCFEQAHVLWHDLGNTHKATGTVRKLGWIAAERGDLSEAIRLFRQALSGYQDPGTASTREAALAMTDLGNALSAAGREAEAVPVLQEAVRLLDGHPDPYNQARALAALGRAQASRPADALPLLDSAMEVMTRLGVVPARAEILETLALIAAQAGDTGSARSRYQEALALLPPGHRRVPAIQRALDALPRPGNDR